jgi:hypothetical protein
MRDAALGSGEGDRALNRPWWLRKHRLQFMIIMWSVTVRPKPRILHPWRKRASPSNTRGGSPYALIGRVRFCAGGARNERPYRDP